MKGFIAKSSTINLFRRPFRLKKEQKFYSQENSLVPQPPPHTHFGFKTVPIQQKEKLVSEVFHSVAEKYDLMNDSMSLGIHRLWKNEFISILNPLPGTHLLDVAGGTGDIAFRFVDAILAHPSYHPQPPPSKVTILDINPSMLQVGQKRAAERYKTDDPTIAWVEGNAESLPFSDSTFDAFTIAFGIRNCTHVDKVVREAFRVLRKGGRFLCLEFSRVDVPLIGSLYDFYSFNVIPVMGHVIAGDWDSYQYLVESIRKFPDQESFADIIRAENFHEVGYKNLMGGVAAIHSGFKL
eukprot:TRINITY_DN6181_c0_g1_i1.p1 TRINITY_DN6181_c0_g1~~TRINITY_DN6181_c0_g1_i1.p1  ORF type:complete len:295 (-),score=62.99 TRINITY_DN6181_c0_g1_i1:165-1049(-)